MDFKEFKEHSVKSGLGTALCYMLQDETKYHILCAVESLPAVFGTPNTIEFSSTTNKAITKVKGKDTVNDIEINLPYNIDTINICNAIRGKEVKFAYIDLDDFSGQEFAAEASYHMADVGVDSIKQIVLVLTVSSAKDQITQDLYDCYEDTITFDDTAIPNVVKASANTSFKVVATPADATISVNTSASAIATGSYASATNTLTITKVAAGSCLITISATKTNFASNKRVVKVIFS